MKSLAATVIFLACLLLTPAEPGWFASSSGAFEFLALLVREARYQPRTLGWIGQGHELDFGLLRGQHQNYLVMDWARLQVPRLSRNASGYELTIAGTISPGVRAIQFSLCGSRIEVSEQKSFLARTRLDPGCFDQWSVLSIEAEGHGEIQTLGGPTRLLYATLDRLEIVPLEIRPATQKYAYEDAFPVEVQNTAGLVASLLDQKKEDAARDFFRSLASGAPNHPAVVRLRARLGSPNAKNSNTQILADK